MTGEAVMLTPEEDAKRRIREGMALMGHGVGRTLRSELAGGISMSMVGLVWGLVSYSFLGGNLREKVAGSMAKTFWWGAVGGWIASPKHYNDMARERGLPLVRWYDALPVSFIAGSIYDQRAPFSNLTRPARLAGVHVANPMTLMGARHLAGGVKDLLLG